MLKKISFFLSALLLATCSYAQSGDFKFTEESFDFGMVNEGVQAQHEFSFTNTGTTPIVISNVRASCGCTTPYWPKDPIAPGAKANIKVSYNSSGRIGTFNKSITITSNAVQSQKVLYIKGIVEKVAPKPEYSEEELKKSATLDIDTDPYDFGKVERGQKVSKVFKVKNSGKTPLTISQVRSACNCITQTLTPETIAPGKHGKQEVIYNPFKDGANKDIITIFSNDLNNPEISITFSADVVKTLTPESPVKESPASLNK